MSAIPPAKPPFTLRVVESLQQDVSYGRARLDAEVRVEQDISPGDIIAVSAPGSPQKFTGAVVWRSHPEDDGKGVIHIDNLIRRNAGVSVGDKVEVRKPTVHKAVRVVVAPAIAEDQKLDFGDGIDAIVKRGLQKRPVVQGDIITVPNIALFGNVLPFVVKEVSTEPGPVDSMGVFLVNEDTRVDVLSQDGKPVNQHIKSRDDSGAYPPVEIHTAAQAAGLAVDIQAYAIDAAATALAKSDKDGEERLAEVAVLATRILHLLGYKLGARN